MSLLNPKEAQATLEGYSRFLTEERSEITGQWRVAVHSDGRLLNSERLSAAQLEAHLPAVFEHLAVLLRSPADHAAREAAAASARVHGGLRFVQGYRLDELVRELCRVRAVLIRYTAGYEDGTPDFRGVVKRVAMERLHGFFDEMICEAAAAFCRDQQAGLRQNLRTERGNLVELPESRSDEREARKAVAAAAETEIAALQDKDAVRLRLLRTVAHELGNNVNLLGWAAHGLKDETNEPARQEMLTMLTRSIDHMGSLLRDLLEYSVLLGPRTLRMEPIHLAEICEELLVAYGPVAQAKGLHFHSDCDPHLATVMSHRTKIVQIASNLLSNAVKYTPSGSIRFWMRRLDGARWSLGVEDSGVGMSGEHCARLFAEFHRAKETAAIDGTGLGLSIVRRLVNLLQGEIRVRSEAGKGSRFEVILPIGGNETENPETKSEERTNATPATAACASPTGTSSASRPR